MPLAASLIFVDLALFPGYVVAQEMVLEVISLEHRLSADVIPLLKPLVAPGGTVTGMSSQLIVRSSQRNLLEIKRVLAAIDRPLRRLKIIVRQQTEQEGVETSQGLSGHYRRGDFALGYNNPPETEGMLLGHRGERGELRYRAFGADDQSSQNHTHLVQTVEGQAAFIYTGRSVPLSGETVIIGPGGAVIQRSSDYRDTASGFYVMPLVNGDRVTLHISPRLEALRGGSGRASIDTQALSTTVSTQLGQWIDLGAVSEQFNDRASGLLQNANIQGQNVRRIWLKVEALGHP
ncbi:MAG: hypothetical protein ACREYE_24445 [Gammaproteobacteria bacterium]